MALKHLMCTLIASLCAVTGLDFGPQNLTCTLIA
jgi:hypothetical protein